MERHVIIESDKNEGYEFDSYKNRPDNSITGDCWVKVLEYWRMIV
jgi:hypothetical protein